MTQYSQPRDHEVLSPIAPMTQYSQLLTVEDRRPHVWRAPLHRHEPLPELRTRDIVSTHESEEASITMGRRTRKPSVRFDSSERVH